MANNCGYRDMCPRRAGQNKAVNHVLITASPEYQQKVFLFDNLSMLCVKIHVLV